jgi:hypothetical protein
MLVPAVIQCHEQMHRCFAGSFGYALMLEQKAGTANCLRQFPGYGRFLVVERPNNKCGNQLFRGIQFDYPTCDLRHLFTCIIKAIETASVQLEGLEQESGGSEEGKPPER